MSKYVDPHKLDLFVLVPRRNVIQYLCQRIDILIAVQVDPKKHLHIRDTVD